jgi:epoxyqueuosine reductase
VGIAAYATGEDYHIVLKQRVRDHILPALQQRWPGEHFRCVTDSAPLLERAYAVRAGLGFIGKNTLHIIPGQGSFHFLAAVVTTADILREWNATPNEKQMPMPNCGQCTRCLDACPTSAFPAPFILDARACISYRTIEDRQSRDYAAEATQHQGLIFGCDICQQVCPYNKSASPTLIPEFLNGRILHRHEPAETFLSAASNRQFARRFQRSPLLRAGRTRILARVRAALANNSPRCNNP